MDLYTGITIVAIVETIVLALHMLRSDALTAKTRQGFAIFCGMLGIVTFVEWAAVALNGTPDKFRLLHSAVKGIEFILAPAVLVTWATLLSKTKKIWHGWLIVILNAIMEIISVFTGWIFYMNSDNVYTRGIIYWFYIVSYVLSLIVLVMEIVKFSSRFQHRNIEFLIGILIVLFVGVVIQVIFSKVRVTWLTGTMCVALLYIYMVEMATQVDMVTKLLNRSSFEHMVESVKYRTAVITFDVDDFKDVNDNYGHAAGDEILEKVGECLKRAYGARGLCYRIGGDEFGVILKKGKLDEIPSNQYKQEQLGQPPIDGFVRATPAIEKMNRRFAILIQEMQQKDARMPDVSFGYYLTDEGIDIHEALDKSDALMYENKRRRKNNRVGRR